jgi:aldehyde dehydrogenase (NAD+)
MTSSMPFDGVGSSGLGRYYGKYGFDSLSPKSRQVNPGVPGRWSSSTHSCPPYTEHKAASLGEWFTVSNPDAQHQEYFF